MSAIDRQYLVKGPAKIVQGSDVFYSVGDIALIPEKNLEDIETALHGKIDQRVLGAFIRVEFTPLGIWSSAMRAQLFPAAYLAPASVGGRIYGNSDTAWAIHSSDGKLFTLHNAQITQMPEINLAAKGDLYGAAQLTCLVKNNTDLSDANAFITVGTTTWNQADFPTISDKVACTAAWGAVTGFTAMDAKEGWRITHELQISGIEVQGNQYDMQFDGYRAIARGMPLQPTADQIIAQSAVGGVAQGARLSSIANDFVISGSGFSATVNAAAPTEMSLLFGKDPLRNGEIAWASNLTFTAGAADARLILA